MLLCLGGCAGVPQAVAPPSAAVQFGVSMHIILQVPGRAKQRFATVWRRTDSGGEAWQDELEFKNPFGSTEARLTIRPREAVLHYDGDKVLRAASGNALAQQVFGAAVPVEAFRHWIRARAAPGRAAVARDAGGSVRNIRQFGWYVEYPAYDAAQRPRTITLHNAELNAQVTVRIRRWL